MRWILIILTTLLLGCINIDSENLPVDSQLYAKLEFKDGSYQFTKFSEYYLKSETWVRLSDLSPMWEKRLVGCLIYSKYKKFNCNYYGIFTNKNEILFNGTNYSLVVNDAIKRLIVNLDKNKRSLSSILDRYSKNRINLTKKIDELIVNYELMNINPIISIQINDLSKMNKIDKSFFKKNVYIYKNNDVKNMSITSKEKYFSAKTLIGLEEKITTYNMDILNKVKELTSYFYVKCYNEKFEGIKYKFSCPSRISVNLSRLNLIVDIEDVFVTNVLPKSIILNDKNIKLKLLGDYIYIENKTSSFISINSISFYYNGGISQLTNLGRELSPSSESNFMKISDFTIQSHLITFNNLIKSKVKKLKIKYGFAIKYHVIDGNKEITLFETRPYVLSSLI